MGPCLSLPPSHSPITPAIPCQYDLPLITQKTNLPLLSLSRSGARGSLKQILGSTNKPVASGAAFTQTAYFVNKKPWDL